MANIKFGVSQIAAQTPKFATYTFRAVLYLCAITAIVCASISEIPDHTKVIILRYAAEATLLVHGLTRMFGIQIDNDPTQQSSNSAANS